MNAPPSDLVLFFGRFHPLLVHLPIGLIVLVGLLELLACWPRFQQARAANGIILTLTVPASLFSALCGWLLSQGGGYDVQLVSLHQWTGFGVAAGCACAWILHRLDWKKAYRLLLAATFAALTVASHFGGSLTHGSDYLTRYAPAPVRAWLGAKSTSGLEAKGQPGDVTNQPMFVAVVLPILQKNCVECHGPEKAKAELRLDSLAALQKGSEDGPVLQPGQAAASSLIKRLLLPLEDENHMPPSGKAQPTPDDLALLRWWVDAGASGDKKLSELTPPPNVQRILASRFAAPAAVAAAAPSSTPKLLAEVLPLAERLVADLGIVVTPLSPNEAWLQCNASVAATNFGDADLAKLAPLALNLRWLDLGGTRVTDTGLVQVTAMKNLTKLHLERTGVTDAGLAHLSSLRELQYLNLYGTPVTDAGLAHLKPLTALRQIYLWQTQVTTNAVAALRNQFVDKDQLRRWQEEIETLQAKIRSQSFVVDVGAPMVAAKKPDAKPINTNCPVSGKDVDPSKTIVHEGKVIAFCCDKCKAEFEKDPKPSLAKLGLTPSAPINTKCPVSGKDIDPSKTVVHEGKVIAFCCDQCKAAFEKDPKPSLAKLGLTAPAPDSKKEQKP